VSGKTWARFALAVGLVLGLACRAATAAAAAGPAEAAAPAPAAATSVSSARAPIVGVQIDAGLPDGAVVSGVYRPVPYARFDAGLTYNLIGVGVRAGATAAPWRFVVTPTLRGELGHTFASDASGFIDNFATLTADEKRALSDVSLTYASLLVGAELGSPDSVVFFVHAGFSWYWATVNNYPGLVRSLDPDVSASDNASVSGRIVSLNLGVRFYVW
jgi:hypothetical protein